MMVPCLGRSSVQGRPLAAECPDGPQTSPGWRARCSRSPGCRHSCARGCKSLPADCSSPGCQGGRVQHRSHPLLPAGCTGPGRLSRRHSGWGRQRTSSSLFRMRKASENGPALGLPRPLLHGCWCQKSVLPFCASWLKPRVWAQGGIPPPSLLHTHPVFRSVSPSASVLPQVCRSDRTLSSVPSAEDPCRGVYRPF